MEHLETMSERETGGEKRRAGLKGLSGSTLKLIAIITMFIDHTGATLLARMLLSRRYIDTPMHTAVVVDYSTLYIVYRVMRSIGRVAFPIFCFLLVEGFQRTHDVKKYALRLGIFALVSEIPFDLAFNARFLEFGYQNVFFTLFLGLLTMMATDWVFIRYKWLNNKIWNRLVSTMFAAAVIFAGCLAAHFLQTDYGEKGVLCIMVLYFTKWWKPVQMLAGAISFFWELPAPAAFIPTAFYNGKRGLSLKYIFYVFYPAHLLLLYLVSLLIGLAGVPVV